MASILFDDDEGTFICSGTLLNDTLDDTFIPYFLTAHHCVPKEVANTVEAWWFFRRAACGLVEIDERFTVTYGGADVLATSLAQDSTLLRLRSPAEVSVRRLERRSGVPSGRGARAPPSARRRDEVFDERWARATSR